MHMHEVASFRGRTSGLGTRLEALLEFAKVVAISIN